MVGDSSRGRQRTSRFSWLSSVSYFRTALRVPFSSCHILTLADLQRNAGWAMFKTIVAEGTSIRIKDLLRRAPTKQHLIPRLHGGLSGLSARPLVDTSNAAM